MPKKIKPKSKPKAKPVKAVPPHIPHVLPPIAPPVAKPTPTPATTTPASIAVLDAKMLPLLRRSPGGRKHRFAAHIEAARALKIGQAIQVDVPPGKTLQQVSVSISQGLRRHGLRELDAGRLITRTGENKQCLFIVCVEKKAPEFAATPEDDETSAEQLAADAEVQEQMLDGVTGDDDDDED